MRALVILLVVGIAYGTWTAINVWLSFRSIDRIALDVEAAQDRIANTPAEELPEPPPVEIDEEFAPAAEEIEPEATEAPRQTEAPGQTEGPGPTQAPLGDEPSLSTTVAPEPPDITGEQLPYDPGFSTSSEVPNEAFEAFLIIGSDAKPNLGGQRADVLILALIPADRSPPILVSLPRDLWLRIPCWNRLNRINATLNGCGDLANGPELLALTVAQFTGIQADHFALFEYGDFERVIDAFGGIKVCVENPVRDKDLEIPAGCTIVDGATALLWVRSRKTEEYVNGRWRTVPGVNDLTRNERQQDVLLQLLGKVNTFDALSSLVQIVESIADAVTIDDRMTIGGAIGLAWGLRGLDPTEVRRVTIPVRFHVTSGGASVLLPTSSFADVLAQVWPGPRLPEN